MKRSAICTGALGLMMAAVPALAHHSFAAEYDEKKPVTLKGTVTQYAWDNPHVFTYIDVAEPGGQIASWAVEWESRIELKRAGWTQDSLKVGEQVTVEAVRARDGSNHAAGKSISVAGGKKLLAANEASGIPVRRGKAKPAPRWPDGHVRLGIGGGELGYWADPSASSLVADNVKIKMNRDGLLANIADADKVAPFKPWAKGLYVYRQRTLLKDDPMASCLPPGGPRQLMVPYGVQILEQPERKRIFLMSGGGNRNWRLIYTDGRELPTSEDATPTYYGNSVGHWDGDTLVVDTVGFNERFWFSNGGLPHTEKLKLTERFSRPDFETLKYDVTVDDPGAYTRTWSSGWTLAWIPDHEIQEYFCDDNNQDQERVLAQ
jgi:hypothetical protein